MEVAVGSVHSLPTSVILTGEKRPQIKKRIKFYIKLNSGVLALLFEVFLEKKMYVFLLRILQIIAFNGFCNIKCTVLELQTCAMPW